MAANKFKMVATEFKSNKFYLKHPKLQVEGCSFYWLDVFLMFVIIDIDTLYYYTSAESKRTQNSNQNSKMAGTELI